MIFANLLGKTACHFFGHKRGRRTFQTGFLRCPRCGKEWLRKIRKPKAAKP